MLEMVAEPIFALIDIVLDRPSASIALGAVMALGFIYLA